MNGDDGQSLDDGGVVNDRAAVCDGGRRGLDNHGSMDGVNGVNDGHGMDNRCGLDNQRRGVQDWGVYWVDDRGGVDSVNNRGGMYGMDSVDDGASVVDNLCSKIISSIVKKVWRERPRNHYPETQIVEEILLNQTLKWDTEEKQFIWDGREMIGDNKVVTAGSWIAVCTKLWNN